MSPYQVSGWATGAAATPAAPALSASCANARCRRAHRCLVPHPCYWERKQAMAPAELAKAEAICRPLRALLSLGSLKGSEGLWLF